MVGKRSGFFKGFCHGGSLHKIPREKLVVGRNWRFSILPGGEDKRQWVHRHLTRDMSLFLYKHKYFDVMNFACHINVRTSICDNRQLSNYHKLMCLCIKRVWANDNIEAIKLAIRYANPCHFNILKSRFTSLIINELKKNWPRATPPLVILTS